MTVQEAARELDVHEATIRKALQQGRLPFTFMYGRKLIAQADLEAYRQRTRPTGEKPRGRPRKPVTADVQDLLRGAGVKI